MAFIGSFIEATQVSDSNQVLQVAQVHILSPY
jgi:hypothetical protein